MSKHITHYQIIGAVTQRTRTIVLHAKSKWPTAMTEDMQIFDICIQSISTSAPSEKAEQKPTRCLPMRHAHGNYGI
jgi:hypothetical protein